MTGGLVLGLPIALALLPASETLRAEIPSAHPFVVVDGSSAGVIVGPDSLRSRCAVRSEPLLPQPGVGWTSYAIDHSHRWQQELQVVTLTGPFASVRDDTCGVWLTFGAGMFDDGALSRALSGVASRAVSPMFPMKIDVPTPIGRFAFTVPAVVSSRVRATLEEGQLRLEVRVALIDGTFVHTTSRIAIRADRGSIVLRRVGRSETGYGGPSFERLREEAVRFGRSLGDKDTILADALCAGTLGLVCPREEAAKAAGRLVDEMVPRVVDQTVETGLDGALIQVEGAIAAMIRHRITPIDGRPDIAFGLHVAADPIVRTSGMHVPLCLRGEIESGAYGGVPGVARLPEEVAPPTTESDAVIGVELGKPALNLILHVLWRSGWLRERGTDPALIASLPHEAGALAFDVTGFEPLLPPTLLLDPTDDSFPIMLGAVKVGMWGDRTVLAQARTALRFQTRSGQVVGVAALESVGVHCARSRAGKTMLEPCLSDLLPLFRDVIADRTVEQRIAGSELVARLPRLAFGGLSLQYGDIDVRARGGRLHIRLPIAARLKP